jgi:hypothetical protein
LPSLSSLILRGDEFFITKDDGEIFIYDKSLRDFLKPETAQKARLISVGDTLRLLTDNRI